LAIYCRSMSHLVSVRPIAIRRPCALLLPAKSSPQFEFTVDGVRSVRVCWSWSSDVCPIRKMLSYDKTYLVAQSYAVFYPWSLRTTVANCQRYAEAEFLCPLVDWPAGVRPDDSTNCLYSAAAERVGSRHNVAERWNPRRHRSAASREEQTSVPAVIADVVTSHSRRLVGVRHCRPSPLSDFRRCWWIPTVEPLHACRWS